MTTYVLVHGAWGGSYSFGATRRLLQAKGHEVFTPSLTGIGERAHLASAQIGLSTHVADVANTILYEDLNDIVLLGFSYGGAVVTGALEHIGDRVAHLVYLDAFVPSDGEVIAQTMGMDTTWLGPGAEWLAPARAREYESAEAEAFSQVRRVMHPMGCFREAARVPMPVEEYPFDLTFVKATGDGRDAGDPFWPAADHANASDRWNYLENTSNHMIPINRPQELADLLEGLNT